MSRLRILLADDHEVVRAGLRALIDGSPHLSVINEAANGEEAVRLACELQPDVVVMDISMPVLDGTAATARIRALCPDVRVLVLTMHEDRAHLARLLDTGASGYVLKRAAADELVRAIRIVAEGGTYVDPELAGSVLSAAARATGGSIATGDPLSDREEEVLRRLAWGETNKHIGLALGISTKTVETYRARIADKLGLRTRTEMVRYALQMGWLTDEHDPV